MMIFSRKPKAERPTHAESVEDFRRKIAEAVADALDAGVTVHEIVPALNQRVELIRTSWAASAPLGQSVP